MKHFLLPRDYAGQAEYVLTGKDYHYLCRVRRVSVQDVFSGVDRTGRRYTLRVDQVTADSCTVAISQAAPPEPTGEPAVTLFQCLPRGTKMDLVVRQATEAGVERLIPLISRFTVAKLDTALAEGNRVERWERIAREAVQQSGSTALPEIHAPVQFERIGEHWSSDSQSAGLFFHQTPLEQRSLHEYLDARPTRVAIVVGPEGGLADSEIAYLQNMGFVPVYLGPRVLRTETAALYAIAAVQIVLLEKKTWQIVRN